MALEIKTITTPFMLNVSVNCYLINVGDGFILIDTAKTGARQAVESALREAGCVPGKLKLIVLTHGDFDHSGNAAYLRKTFGAKIAMHADDAGMVERGDMLWNRKKAGCLMGTAFKLLFRLSRADRFTPDVTLREGYTLAEYGLDATIVELPGHSKGNVGILTAEGDLFCGDLLGNTDKPAVWSIVDNPAEMAASVEKVKGLAVNTVYPGHGKLFPIEAFLNS